MPIGIRVLIARIPKGVPLWAGLTLLFALLLVFGIGTIASAPKMERLRALKATQRLTIDAASGAITGLAKKAEAEAPEPAPATAAEPSSEPRPTGAPASNPAAAPAAETPPAAETAATPTDATKLAIQPPASTLPTITPSSDALVVPPAKEITEMDGDLSLPRRGTSDNNTRAATLYAKNFSPKPDTKLVSILLTDAGFNPQTTAQILKMPNNITVAFSSYAPDALTTITALHQAGYETWGMFPTMGNDYPQKDPGPLGIISSLPPEENVRRLHQTLHNTLGAAGLVFPTDETLSSHGRVLSPLLDEINTRGLFILTTRANVSIDTLAGKNAGLKAAIRKADILLDANATAAEIQSKLDGIQPLLNERDALILVAPAQPQMLSILSDWLAHNGLGPSVELAPLSAQYRDTTAPLAADALKKPEKKEEPKPTAASTTSSSELKSSKPH